MQGDAEVFRHLNLVLRNELTAINQYFLHSRMLADWGVRQLADKAYQESIEEMHHADELIQRILFLEGVPAMQELGRLRIGETVEETIQCDLALEMDAIPYLREAVHYCETIRDFASRDLFDKILIAEEEHVDWLETQFTLIKQVGIQNYIAAKS